MHLISLEFLPHFRETTGRLCRQDLEDIWKGAWEREEKGQEKWARVSGMAPCLSSGVAPLFDILVTVAATSLLPRCLQLFILPHFKFLPLLYKPRIHWSRGGV